MGWPSYAESIDAIRCDLEHLAGCLSESVDLDEGSAAARLAAAELVLSQICEAVEVATDPNLEIAGEIARLRALTMKHEQQRRLDLERIHHLSRQLAARALDTIYWRDEYFELSRRTAKPRRRQTQRRHR
jgi:hypothetical protein